MLTKMLWPVCALLLLPLAAQADLQTYGFDDGTLQGWSFTDTDLADLTGATDESAVLWEISLDEVDLGENGWNLLQGSTENGIGSAGDPQRVPNYRVIPMPWADRDCLSGPCLSMLMSSPVFKLDDSGPISVDIVGGQGKGGANVDPDDPNLPVFVDDLSVERNGEGYQGFALYDVGAGEYVEYGFPTFNNDGKEKDGRDVWETVEIPAEDLAAYANDGKDYRVDVFDSLSGGWGWMGFDTVRIPNADFTATTTADCNNSGGLDAGDLACVASIDDRDAVLSALGTVPGDLDGNGFIEFADFLTLSANFGNDEGAYSDGNIDLVDGVAFADFLTLSASFGREPAAIAAVPEPSTQQIGLLALLGICFGWRRMRLGR